MKVTSGFETIYGIECPIIRKLIYVGRSADYRQRKSCHKNKSYTRNVSANRWLDKAIEDMRWEGWNGPIIQPIAAVPAAKITEMETWWIAEKFKEGHPLLNIRQMPEGSPDVRVRFASYMQLKRELAELIDWWSRETAQ